MTERRRPALRPRDTERLRTLSAGVMGGVPGSVPVSASGNGASVPSSVPVVPYNPIHAPTAIDFPNPPSGGGGIDLPRWDWPGLVNATGLFVAWPLDGPETFTEVVVVMTQASAAIVFNITENGTTVDTITCAATQLQVITLTPSFSSVLDDLLNINITNIDTGAAHGLHIALRP